jgi:DNA-binding NtrC family response regulator
VETILIVDDDKDLQFNLSHILQDEGYNTIGIERGKQAVPKIKKVLPAIVLLDINLTDISGMKVLENIKEMVPSFDGFVIILTAYGDVKSAIRAMKLGAYDYITKPFDNEGLILTIEKALNTRQLSKEVVILREKLDDKQFNMKLMGNSPQITRTLKQVEIISPTNLSVIIQGASGTGKEVIAKLIHQKSLRRDKPFVPIDCGAIPESLVESELFGYEKGAFTGANVAKKGKFELANKGTLLLDEITNLSENSQAKLLRAIEERKIQPLGGKKEISIDVRIISNSNIDIIQAVNQGKFRDDLFHRLNEFKIILPMLKERKEDIPVLAKYFLDEANNELHKNITGFSTAAMKKLLNYFWAGNVRELKNVVKRAVLLEERELILAETLEFEETQIQNNSQEDLIEDYSEKIFRKDYSLKDIIAALNSDVEKEIIESILEKVNYNKSKAAKVLGIERKTLYSKMKILEIEK